MGLPRNPQPGVTYQIDYTTQTDQELLLSSVVKPAGGLPCASSYELEQQQNQSENDIFGGSTSVFGGPMTATATDTENTAGPYLICTWIEGPDNAEVDAATTTSIYVGTPPPTPGPTSSAGSGGHAASCHAGRVEGDGEYSDGAIIWVNHITCRRALALVKPRYHRIRLMRIGHHFRLGQFACRITYPGGPDTVKVCRYRADGFRFV